MEGGVPRGSIVARGYLSARREDKEVGDQMGRRERRERGIERRVWFEEREGGGTEKRGARAVIVRSSY